MRLICVLLVFWAALTPSRANKYCDELYTCPDRNKQYILSVDQGPQTVHYLCQWKACIPRSNCQNGQLLCNTNKFRQGIVDAVNVNRNKYLPNYNYTDRENNPILPANNQRVSHSKMREFHALCLSTNCLINEESTRRNIFQYGCYWSHINDGGRYVEETGFRMSVKREGKVDYAKGAADYINLAFFNEQLQGMFKLQNDNTTGLIRDDPVNMGEYGLVHNELLKARAKEIGCAQRTSRADMDTGDHWYHIVCAINSFLYFPIRWQRTSRKCGEESCEYPADKRAVNGCTTYDNLCGVEEVPFDEDDPSMPLTLRGYQRKVHAAFGDGCKEFEGVSSEEQDDAEDEEDDDAAMGDGGWEYNSDDDDDDDDYDEREHQTGQGAAATATTKRAKVWPTRTLAPKPVKPDRNFRILSMLQRLLPMLHRAIDIVAEKKRKFEDALEIQDMYLNVSRWENYTFPGGATVPLGSGWLWSLLVTFVSAIALLKVVVFA